MKKIILTLIVLLGLYGNAHGQILQAVAAASGGAAGCVSSTDYLGDKTDRTEAANYSTNVIACYGFQASTAACSAGAFGVARWSHDTTGNDNVRICVYQNQGGNKSSAPTTGDAQVGSCVPIEGCTTDGNCVSTNKIGGTATKDAWYWACAITDATQWGYNVSSSQCAGSYRHVKALWSYGSEPAGLTSASWTSTDNRCQLGYVEIE